MRNLSKDTDRGQWRKTNQWKLWSGSSIWSVVCAMELGILTESNVRNIPLSSLCRRPGKKRGRKPKSRRGKYARKLHAPKINAPRRNNQRGQKSQGVNEDEKRESPNERREESNKENDVYTHLFSGARRFQETAVPPVPDKAPLEVNYREGELSENDVWPDVRPIPGSEGQTLVTGEGDGQGNQSNYELWDPFAHWQDDRIDFNMKTGENRLPDDAFDDVAEDFAEESFETSNEIAKEIANDIGNEVSSDRDILREETIAKERSTGTSGRSCDLDDLPLAQRMSVGNCSNVSPRDDNGNYPKDGRAGSQTRRKTWAATTQEESKEFYEPRRITRRLMKITEEIVKENFVGKLVWGSCSGWWPAIIIDGKDAGMSSTPGKVWVFWIGESRISLLNEKTQVEPFSNKLKLRLEKKSDARDRCIETTIQMLRKQLGCVLTKPYHVWLEKNLPELDRRDEIKFYPYPPNIQRRLGQLKEQNIKATEKYDSEMKRWSDQSKKQASEKGKEVPSVSPDRLPLKEQRPGVITWAKIAGVNWWPAMIVDYRDCCMREPSFGCQWIMWYGDYKLSQIHHSDFMKFHIGLEKMREYIQNTKRYLYLVGVLQASKDYCARLGHKVEKWTLADTFKWSSKHRASSDSNEWQVPNGEKYSEMILRKLNELKINQNVDAERQHNIKHSEALKSVISGKNKLESLCLMCMEVPSGEMEVHPFFEGSLCLECSEELKPRVFVIGDDGKCYYCTVCAGFGFVVMCDRDDCPRVYCTACLKYLLCPETYNEVLLADPWECFLCKNDPDFPGSMITPRVDWKNKLALMFRKSTRDVDLPNNYSIGLKRKIRVLSLFDGLSTGLVVLLKLGLVPEVYYASEIDIDALTVSSSHFGDRVIQLGDVRNITKQKLKEIAPIDLLIGGSPCNDLSLVNPARLGLHDPNGTGILFFEYTRILETMKKLNKDRHLFWMYENVASMPSKYRLEINQHLGQEPDLIDSADFSPQHRLRLYWHNLPIDPRRITLQSQQDVQDVLTPNCDRYALVKKIRTVTTRVNSLKQGKFELKPILMRNESDTLWITELEEIFGFPRHYTDVKNMSATKRQKLIGKSWSVQTLTAVLQPLSVFFENTSTSA